MVAADELTGTADANQETVFETEGPAGVRLWGRRRGMRRSIRSISYVDAASPGSVLTVCLDDGTARAGFDAYGAPENRTEAVASEVADQVRRFRGSGGVVDAHLADQLVVFLALAGGTVSIADVTPHVESARTVLEAFDRDVRVDRSGTSPTLVADH